MRSGADFSGAIFSLDTGNRVFPPLFTQGGGFGVDEFTGFPDEVELYITRLACSWIRLDEPGEGQPGPAPEVEVFQRGYQFLSDARLDGIGETLEAPSRRRSSRATPTPPTERCCRSRSARRSRPSRRAASTQQRSVTRSSTTW